VIKQYQETNQP